MQSDETYANVSFYIVPHADDWQLFMQPNARNDLIDNNKKVVYIFTTAGDAGKEDIYWKAREEGAKSSIRCCLLPFGSLNESSGTKMFHSHNINYWTCNNVISYFMRLPDGNMDGNGFARYKHHSLSKFATAKIDTLTSVDDSTTYSSWQNLQETLADIIETESTGYATASVNYLDPSVTANPNDHPDHIATGNAIQNLKNISQFQQVLFLGYSLRNSYARIEETDFFWKTMMFAVYEKAVFDGSGISTLQEGIEPYLEWCSRHSKYTVIDSE